MGEEVDEWISQFKGELERGLRTRLRGVRLPPTAAGDLAEEPSRQLARSFPFILIVGDHRAGDEGCQQTIQVLIQMYGDTPLGSACTSWRSHRRRCSVCSHGRWCPPP